MAPFLFLKLPLLVQKDIIGQIKYCVLIELSFMSKKFKKVMELVKTHVDSVEFLFDATRIDVTIKRQHVEMTIEVMFNSNETSKAWKLNGCLVPIIHEDYYNPYFITITAKCDKDTDESKVELLKKMTTHLLSILNVQEFKLFFRKSYDLDDFFLWKYNLRFKRISLVGLSLEPFQLNFDELKVLLEEVSANYLWLNVEFVSDPYLKYQFQPQRPPKIREMYIRNANWVDFDTVSNIECEKITISDPQNSNSIVNKTILNWISGNNKTLEKLDIPSYEVFGEQVLEGTNATRSEFKEIELEDRTCIHDNSTFWDIRRHHDGRLATVILSKHAVKLLVWNEKHLRAIGKL